MSAKGEQVERSLLLFFLSRRSIPNQLSKAVQLQLAFPCSTERRPVGVIGAPGFQPSLPLCRSKCVRSSSKPEIVEKNFARIRLCLAYADADAEEAALCDAAGSLNSFATYKKSARGATAKGDQLNVLIANYCA